MKLLIHWGETALLESISTFKSKDWNLPMVLPHWSNNCWSLARQAKGPKFKQPQSIFPYFQKQFLLRNSTLDFKNIRIFWSFLTAQLLNVSKYLHWILCWVSICTGQDRIFQSPSSQLLHTWTGMNIHPQCPLKLQKFGCRAYHVCTQSEHVFLSRVHT